MGYVLVTDDNFHRANTSVGLGAGSTNVGNGWIDNVGNLFSISANTLVNYPPNLPGQNLPLNGLYRQSSEWGVDGKVRIYSTGSNGPGAMGRFNPAGGGSGYTVMLFGGSWYGYKAVAGVQSGMLNPVSAGTIPTNFYWEFSWTQLDEATTQFNAVMFNADTDAITNTRTWTDTTAALQNVSGGAGVCSYNNTNWARVQTYAASVALAAGTNNAARAFITAIQVSATAASGGTGTKTYQWYKSTASGTKGTAISGATSVSQSLLGLTANTDYYFTLTATDSATPTPVSVDYAQFYVKTLPTTALTILEVGDSITAGVGSTLPGLPFVDTQIARLNTDNFPSIAQNAGVSGQTTGSWAPGGSVFNAAIALSVAAGGANTASIMLGANDGNTGVDAATYKTNLQALIAGLYSSIPTLQRVFIHYTPYASASHTLVATYLPQIDSMVNGTTIFAGDKTAFSEFQIHTEYQGDSLHPSQLGHNYIGVAQALPIEAVVRIFRPTGGKFTGGIPALTAGINQ